ncbi:MAG: formylglycine-generating enzyme family protein [Desulfuromonadia bacterium]
MKLKRVFLLILAFTLSATMAGAAEKFSPAKKKSVVPTASKGKYKGYKDPATGMEFVYVKGGCFPMGSDDPDARPDEKPVHEVCLSDFYIGKHEVTLAQWEKIMGRHEQTDSGCGPECALHAVSWDMAQQFITKLNAKSKGNYRLPTEAEWEYAARSGGKAETWSGTNDVKDLGAYAFYKDSSGERRHPGGKKKPNGLGIHDMSGNFFEWCQDWYDEGYYGKSPKDNPTGPASGEKRVLRGGAFSRDASEIRTTRREADDPTVWDGDYGFRLVKPVK